MDIWHLNKFYSFFISLNDKLLFRNYQNNTWNRTHPLHRLSFRWSFPIFLDNMLRIHNLLHLPHLLFHYSSLCFPKINVDFMYHLYLNHIFLRFLLVLEIILLIQLSFILIDLMLKLEISQNHFILLCLA